MASDDASGDRAAAATGELKAIRERVVALEKRLREQPSPEAVAELHAEIEKFTGVLGWLSEAPAGAASADEAATWPRDLNGTPLEATWGTDPAEVAGG